MEENTRRAPKGWKRIAKTAAAVTARLDGREIALEADASTWLTLTPAETEPHGPSEEVAGALAAAAALSRETCAGCGGAGDPVRRTNGRLTTRCRTCRTSGDEVLPRGWRPPQRDAAAQRLERLIGTNDLMAIMNAAKPPGSPKKRWPHSFVGGSGTGMCESGIGAEGWNHLIRAAYGELVPANSETGWSTISQIKEKFGGLVIYSSPVTSFWNGFKRMMNEYSKQVCIRCGRPGRLRNVRMTADGPKHTGGWVRPECSRCRKKYEE